MQHKKGYLKWFEDIRQESQEERVRSEYLQKKDSRKSRRK